MAIYDVNYVLASNVTVTADVNGSDVSMIQGGQLEGLKAGMIVAAKLIVTGAIDDTSGNETVQFVIQEKVGSSYRDIGCFPVIGGTLDDNPDVDNSGAALRCFFVPSFNAVALRYRTVTGGTTPSVAGVNITLHPQNYSPSV